MSPEYRAALLASRQRMGSLERATAREIQRAILDWAERLARYLASRPADPRLTAVTETRRLILETAQRMAGQIRRAALTGRDVAFEDTLRLWQQATLQVAKRRDIPNALLGAVRVPNLPILAIHGARPGARTWATVLDRYAGEAGREVDAIVRRALLDGVSPPELAQRLRRYVRGSETLAGAFRTVETVDGEAWRINLRDIPESARGAARQMEWNSLRIAWTEQHAARHEAELQRFLRDPLIGIVGWRLANDRGAQNPPAPPDACDVMAKTDWYGLGPGNFPLDAVPALLHPLDRCDLEPIERKVSEAGDPKPMNLDRVTEAEDATIPRGHLLSEAAEARLRASVAGALRFADEQGGHARRVLGPTDAGRNLAGMVRP